MKPRLQQPCLIALLCLLGLTAVKAQPMTPLHVDADPASSQYRIPLGWLNNRSHAPIELNGADARRVLKVPLPARLAVQDARLEMVYTNSTSLTPRSQLAVTLNERVVAQLPVKPRQPDNAARIRLDFRHLEPGYHDLGFRAAQHYTNECEDPSAPELYSQIDAIDSSLYLTATRKAIEPSLARLGDIFDNRLWIDDYRLEILTPPAVLGEDGDLRQAAAQISQFVAATFDFTPVSVRVNELPEEFEKDQKSKRRLPGVELPEGAWDAVLLGTREQLAPYLSDSLIEEIQGSHIGLYPSDQDPTRFILLVSGATPADVRKAATVLNLPGLALPERQSVNVTALRLDSGYQRSRPAQSETGWIRFDQLGFRSTTLRGMYPGAARLEFWSIREILDPSRPFIDLQLHYAYGAGFDRKSALNVVLNGQFIEALPLQNVVGEQVHRARLRIPTVALRAGVNELRFEPTVIGVDIGGACTPIFTDNLQVTIFEDSRIELPPIADYMRLPDLGLFSQTGLPYTRYSDGNGVGVLIADDQPQTLGSALTLIAKLRQVNKAPLTALHLLADDDSLDGLDSLIVIGDTTSLPTGIGQKMAAFMPMLRWQTIQVGSYHDRTLSGGFKRWLRQPLTPLTHHMETSKPAIASVTLDDGLGQSTALVQFRDEHGRPVTVLTAADRQQLERGMVRLTEHRVWSSMRGGAFMWSADGEAMSSAEPVVYFFIGDSPATGRMSHYMSMHPWWTVLATMTFILALVLLTWWLLRRRARQFKSGAETP
ncbi:cellulose biosynthesis cyclic di-GMP-binding regulatory protein BcsB [Rehaibacterium terrae]|jgi:hypothetical protein|uniref:Cyclic di-GMP-binding protein n=1 Tax=Rehaibacterium terrae TaxID=1341696 RepID=A0A7W8DEF6_9GAMM|nr:cellulose biosynthesis cyclic di-GMP-binding regulatory protein BcsB [Rehaibacterium terrae]MBB5015708.1 hypothetical protein [Rehaibacterium terrae]